MSNQTIGLLAITLSYQKSLKDQSLFSSINISQISIYTLTYNQPIVDITLLKHRLLKLLVTLVLRLSLNLLQWYK